MKKKQIKKKLTKKMIYSGVGIIAVSAAIVAPIVILNKKENVEGNNIIKYDEDDIRENVINQIGNDLPVPNDNIPVPPNKDFINAQANAEAQINAIKTTQTLLKGANLPTTEKNNFDQGVTDALTELNNATSTQDLATVLTKQIELVTNLKDAYDTAIINANNAFNLKTLNEAKANAEAQINMINPTITLLNGAVLPTTEKNNFDQGVTTALAKLNSATSTQDLATALTKQIELVTNLKDAYDTAIINANNAFNLKTLNEAKTNAEAQINMINPTITLLNGANLPTTEKNNFDQGVTNALADLNSTTSTQDLATALTKQIELVTNLKDAYDTAIINANNAFNLKTLNEAKANAEAQINMINPTITLLNGAVLPTTEKNNFDQGVTNALADLNSTTSTQDLATALNKQVIIVTNLKDAYDIAIIKANNAFNLKTLNEAKANAEAQINMINPTINLLNGAVLPTTEKNNFDQGVTDALTELNNATSTQDLATALTKQIKLVTDLKDAYNTAIIKANNAFNLKTLNATKAEILETINTNVQQINEKLLNGAKEPSTEKDDFTQAITIAIGRIKSAKSQAEFDNIVEDQGDLIDQSFEAYDNAITKANAEWNKNLLEAKKEIIEDFNEMFKQSVQLLKGATSPISEKNKLKQAWTTALEEINNSVSPDEFMNHVDKHAIILDLHTSAYDAAIINANNAFNLKTLNEAKANAEAQINMINPTITLLNGAVLPTTEKNNFDQGVTTALAKLNSATSTQDLATALTKQIKLVTNLKDAYDTAIINANNAFNLKTLNVAKTNAEAQINAIKPAIILLNGANEPSLDKGNFDQAINDAINEINATDEILEITKILRNNKIVVTDFKDTYETAIINANAEFALNEAKAKAVLKVSEIKATRVLIQGATDPIIEKNDFERAKSQASIKINASKDLAEVAKILQEEMVIITAKQKVYDMARLNSSVDFQTLKTPKQTAIYQINALKTMSVTLNPKALEPALQKSNFYASIDEAIAEINTATSKDEIESMLKRHKKWINQLKWTYEQGISAANYFAPK